jgi:hypothetical protein
MPATIAGCVIILGATAAWGQACPAKGTIVQGRNPQGAFTLTAQTSTVPVCVAVTEGAGAGEGAGKPVRRIYGWYDLTHYTWTTEMRERAQVALAAVLSGETQEARFALTLGRLGMTETWSGTVSWRRAGVATLPLGRGKIDTIVLKNSFEGGEKGKYDEVWDLWYAPSVNLWVKGEKRRIAGGPVIGGFEVLSVAEGRKGHP